MADGWQEFRELMPITEQWTYLDHAAVAPLPGEARIAGAARANPNPNPKP